jgi:hypothetical protein
MFQLCLLLTPGSNLPIATLLPALPWIWPPREGLHAVQVGALGGGLHRRLARVDDPPASQHAPLGNPPTLDGTTQGSWGVPMATVDAGDDVGDAGVSQRWTSAWARLPTTPMTPLLRLPHAASSRQIR